MRIKATIHNLSHGINERQNRRQTALTAWASTSHPILKPQFQRHSERPLFLANLLAGHKSPKRSYTGDLKRTSAIIYNPIILGTKFVAAPAPVDSVVYRKHWTAQPLIATNCFELPSPQTALPHTTPRGSGMMAIESRRLAAVRTQRTTYALLALTLAESHES
ncbi:unnamed protein product [Ceratitis capitata]|uniref:(Mediterranean fruit fly) hypothetical protein n=1 Tax=Ceratitis capitata TaxID=7213 RepID=A0A811U8M2_CERCA|nr:unnamed protein product [Ceratitis capitata]